MPKTPHPYSPLRRDHDLALARSLAAELDARLASPGAPDAADIAQVAIEWLDALAADARAANIDLLAHVAATSVQDVGQLAAVRGHHDLHCLEMLRNAALDVADLLAELNSPVAPAHPLEPLAALQPATPVEPVSPIEPVAATEPVEPIAATEPTQPIEPTEPIEPVAAVEPITPIEPVAPLEPLTLAESPLRPAPATPASPFAESMTFPPELDERTAAAAEFPPGPSLTPALAPEPSAAAPSAPAAPFAESMTFPPELDARPPAPSEPAAPAVAPTFPDELEARLSAAIADLTAASTPTPPSPAAPFAESMTFPPELDERTAAAAEFAPSPTQTPAPALDPAPSAADPAAPAAPFAESMTFPPELDERTAAAAEFPAPALDAAPTDLTPAPEPAADPASTPDPSLDPAAAAPTELTPEQMAALMGGAPAAPPPDAPMSGELTPEQIAAMLAGDSGPEAASGGGWGSTPLVLTPDKAELLQFMVADAKATLDQFENVVAQLSQFATREEGATSLRELTEASRKIAEFFSFRSVTVLTTLLASIADAVVAAPEAVMPELLVRVRGVGNLLAQHSRGLEVGMELNWPLDTLVERVELLLAGRALHPDIVGWHQDDLDRLLELDGVCEGVNNPPRPPQSAAPEGAPGSAPAAGAEPAARAAAPADAQGPATVRVPAAALDKLLEMISQLVLNKNRVVALSRALRTASGQARADRLDDLGAAADDLAQLSSSLQATMMQARMQPIHKLFERYPRVVRDVANIADKQVELTLAGEGTQVDKSVFDGLGEPLGQLMRMIVTRFVEAPADRVRANKPAGAVIRLAAENQGNQVVVSVEHDGAQPDLGQVAAQAAQNGLATAEELEALQPGDIYALMFREAYGDPQTSAVARAVADLKGKLDTAFSEGRTRIRLTIPLSVAIIPAVMVGIGDETYAVPLQNVEEIVKIDPAAVGAIHKHPVLPLRDEVLPLLDVGRMVEFKRSGPPPAGRVGVVIKVGEERAALLVDRIVGKQEVVIKTLDRRFHPSDLFAGATIRDDGRISLILETSQVIRQARRLAEELRAEPPPAAAVAA